MNEPYYKDALKLAQKEYRTCAQQGKPTSLPVLDELVSSTAISKGVDLGVLQVPAEFIIGTKTKGRVAAFATNFMPILDEESEFADKWKRLCEAHLNEGIREPIKAYEYMNRYYVEEGNKRVCVLKFFGAADIAAEVIRILPEKTGRKRVTCYYELLDFAKYSGVNYVEFSLPGSYDLLQKYVGKEPEESWDDLEQNRFKAAHYYFKQAFLALKGDRFKITIGDALLVYLRIYGYADLCEKNGDEIKKSLNKIWEEIRLLEEEDTIDLKSVPEIEKKKTLLSKMMGDGSVKNLKVAFIYDKNPDISGWVYGHELGRMHLDRVFEGVVQTTAYHDAMREDPLAAVRQAIADGNKILFTTSAKFLPACMTAAVEHPEVKILNCSLNKSHRYIRTYYARMYEVKFIIGAIAGAMTKNDKVGYLCDYPIYGQIAGINAFALGVQMVNPNAKVYLEWSCVDGAENAINRLKERDVRIISSQDMAKAEGDERISFGLYEFDGELRKNLAMPLWHWGVYYEKLIRSISNKTFQSEYESSKKALNYYWGMSAGVVEVLYSSHLPESVKKLADLLKNSISNDLFAPFQGTIYAQYGERVEGTDQALSLTEIITMDWLAENIVGSIPVYEQLSDEGKATVDSAGAPAAM